MVGGWSRALISHSRVPSPSLSPSGHIGLWLLFLQRIERALRFERALSPEGLCRELCTSVRQRSWITVLVTFCIPLPEETKNRDSLNREYKTEHLKNHYSIAFPARKNFHLCWESTITGPFWVFFSPLEMFGVFFGKGVLKMSWNVIAVVVAQRCACPNLPYCSFSKWLIMLCELKNQCFVKKITPPMLGPY